MDKNLKLWEKFYQAIYGENCAKHFLDYHLRKTEEANLKEIEQILSRLPVWHSVIIYRFGLTDGSPKTLEEIAQLSDFTQSEQSGKTRSREVRRIKNFENHALNQLRRCLYRPYYKLLSDSYRNCRNISLKEFGIFEDKDLDFLKIHKIEKFSDIVNFHHESFKNNFTKTYQDLERLMSYLITKFDIEQYFKELEKAEESENG